MNHRGVLDKGWFHECGVTEPHAPKQAVAANEVVIERGTSVKHKQRKEKPRSDAVRQTGRIHPEVRQQRAFSAKDHWSGAAQRHHATLLAIIPRMTP